MGLGLPSYLMLRRLGWTRWWLGVIGGFPVGSLPYGLVALPWTAAPPELVAARVIAPFSWLHYSAVAAGLGLLGMAGSIAAWLTWRALGATVAEDIVPR